MRQERGVAATTWEADSKACREALQGQAGWDAEDIDRVWTREEKRLRTAWLAAREKEISGLGPQLSLWMTIFIAVAASMGGLPTWETAHEPFRILPGLLSATVISLFLAALFVYIYSKVITPSLRHAAVIQECLRVLTEATAAEAAPAPQEPSSIRFWDTWPLLRASRRPRDNGPDPDQRSPR